LAESGMAILDGAAAENERSGPAEGVGHSSGRS
jgi:hypothetical protein